MNQKQFDHIDEKIKAAAAAEPDFNEQAWDRMHSLLDKEDEKKRPLFWYWISATFIVATLAGIMYFNRSSNPSEQVATIKTEKTHAVPEANNMQAATENQQSNPALQNRSAESSVQKKAGIKPVIAIADSRMNIQDETSFAQPNNPTTSVVVFRKSEQNIPENKEQITMVAPTKSNVSGLPVVSKSDEAVHPQNPILQADSLRENNDEDILLTEKMNQNAIIEAPQKEPLKKMDQPIYVTDTTEQKKSESKHSKWYFLANVGTELSSLKLFKFKGSVPDLRVGIGFGYQFTKRLSVQAGITAGQKKYFAEDPAYKMPNDPYWNNAHLISLDADCYVLEIPLQLRYNVVQKKNMNYYATAGLATLIMQKEDYQYTYYRYTNPTVYRSDKSYTGNKHLFSVVQLGIGIERKISSQFFLLASPYVSLPLQGVGEGEVNLFSTGLQIGIKYSPIKK